MFKTKNDLPEPSRVKAVELLNARLADCKDLQTQVKQAHWNVKGPNFISLHLLFDKINDDVEEYVDEIAERAVQLGGIAEGTARMVAKRSSLAEYPVNAVDGRSHVEALSTALAAFGKARARPSGGQRPGRPGHRRPVYRGVARHRQVAVVRGGAPARNDDRWGQQEEESLADRPGSAPFHLSIA